MPSYLNRVMDFLGRRRTAYIRTFMCPPGQEVLQDLAKFCRATESTFHADPRVEGRLDGRREVWLRNQRHLNMTNEQLNALHAPAVQAERRDDDE